MKPKGNEQETEVIQFTLRLTKKTHTKVAEQASKNKRSLNKEIEFILENELEK